MTGQVIRGLDTHRTSLWEIRPSGDQWISTGRDVLFLIHNGLEDAIRHWMERAPAELIENANPDLGINYVTFPDKVEREAYFNLLTERVLNGSPRPR